jgi:ATP-dependent DNA helicase RecQ
LNYFGEVYKQDKCGSCDNCLHPKKSFDGQEEIVTMLEVVKAVKEKFQGEHIINILTGKVENAVKLHRHDQLEEFGTGDDHEAKFWTAIVRQSILNGFLSKEIETYGTLKLTDKGKAFIKKPFKVAIVEDADYSNTESDSDDDFVGGGGTAADPELFASLKDLTKKTAKRLNLPPFVVFQDPSLEEMAINYPITMDELKNISGVGAGKAAKFGKPFIDLISKYVEENEIERPLDMIVKSVVNKSGLKVYLIQNIDRKISLNDMARSKGMTLSELLDEIETIVASGTRIDINYYINEVIDEDRQKEVFNYFKTADSDSAEFALLELGEDDYTLDDIRLMRIKFMSELGN